MIEHRNIHKYVTTQEAYARLENKMFAVTEYRNKWKHTYRTYISGFSPVRVKSECTQVHLGTEVHIYIYLKI